MGRWGEGLVRVALPPVYGFCCKIIATDAGYIGLSDAVEPGYPQGNFGWGALIFSPDGLTWQRIERLLMRVQRIQKSRNMDTLDSCC